MNSTMIYSDLDGIADRDAKIDKLVYALYGLTEEEIKIVEESAK